MPAKSTKSTVKSMSPSLSPDCMRYVAVHSFALPETVAALPSIVTVGYSCKGSATFDSKDNVTISPSLAYALFALFEDIVTAVRTGTALSKITDEPFVVAVTSVPELPDKSENAMDIAT